MGTWPGPVFVDIGMPERKTGFYRRNVVERGDVNQTSGALCMFNFVLIFC